MEQEVLVFLVIPLAITDSEGLMHARVLLVSPSLSCFAVAISYEHKATTPC
jgi:hypothetical protein